MLPLVAVLMLLGPVVAGSAPGLHSERMPAADIPLTSSEFLDGFLMGGITVAAIGTIVIMVFFDVSFKYKRSNKCSDQAKSIEEETEWETADDEIAVDSPAMGCMIESDSTPIRSPSPPFPEEKECVDDNAKATGECTSEKELIVASSTPEAIESSDYAKAAEKMLPLVAVVMLLLLVLLIVGLHWESIPIAEVLAMALEILDGLMGVLIIFAAFYTIELMVLEVCFNVSKPELFLREMLKIAKGETKNESEEKTAVNSPDKGLTNENDSELIVSSFTPALEAKECSDDNAKAAGECAIDTVSKLIVIPSNSISEANECREENAKTAGKCISEHNPKIVPSSFISETIECCEDGTKPVKECTSEKDSVLPVAPSTTPLPDAKICKDNTKAAGDCSSNRRKEESRELLKSLRLKLEYFIPATTSDKGFHYWVLPLRLSQSVFRKQYKISSACTLISLNIAAAFSNDKSLAEILAFTHPSGKLSEKEQFVMRICKICPPEMIEALKYAIVKGNLIYDTESWEKKERSALLTVPEGIELKNKFDSKNRNKNSCIIGEVDFVKMNSGPFVENLMKCVQVALECPALNNWKTYCFVIMKEEKAFTIIYRKDLDLFVLVDSHAHDKFTTGAIIATSNRANFAAMISHLDARLFLGGGTRTEISLVQVKNATDSKPLNPPLASPVKVFDKLKDPKIEETPHWLERLMIAKKVQSMNELLKLYPP